MESVILAALISVMESNKWEGWVQNTSIGSVEPPGPLMAGSSSMILPFYDIQRRRDSEDDRFWQDRKSVV